MVPVARQSIQTRLLAAITALVVFFLTLVAGPTPAKAATLDPTAFALEYTIADSFSNADRTVTLPLFGTVNATIDWGDGSSTTSATTAGNVTHVYARPGGTFTVQITGAVGQFGNGVNQPDSNLNLKKVLQFGSLTGLTSLTGAFKNARTLSTVPATLPAGITDLSYTFAQNLAFNGDITAWDTAAVTNMAYMFQDAWAFDQNIGSWDTSKVTNMSHMFHGNWSATKFNKDIGGWDVSKVTDMSYMFAADTYFNQDLSNWNTAAVTDMSYMFATAIAFNKPLPQVAAKWNTAAVTNMKAMFSRAYAFNQALNSWDVSSVTNMSEMFFAAGVFNQPLDSWSVSNVTNMSSMFYAAGIFNGDISTWDVGAVTTFNAMFREDYRFNSDISAWDTSSATDLAQMFYGASAFNADISGWNVSNVTTLAQTFAGANIFNADISAWNVSKVTTLYATFQGARAFNQDITTWDVSSVTTLNSTFDGAYVFNQDISVWDVSKVTSFYATFSNTRAFNQPVGEWNTAAGTTMAHMFKGTLVFDQPLVPTAGKWNTSNVTDMQYMFSGANVFNQTVADWDTAKVTNMEGMFQNTGAYDLPMPQVVGKWVTTNVTNMQFMFDGADVFNQSVASWNTAKVTSMYAMFQDTGVYDLPMPQVTGQWTTANVTNLAQMFAGAQEFNQDLSSWDTSKVQTLQGTFARTVKFNQDLTAWDTAAVTNMYQTFAWSEAYNQPMPTTTGGWTTANVTQMGEMFRGSKVFNQPLNTWDVSKVYYMAGVFYGALAFDNDISDWNTSGAREMYNMFRDSIFNQDISGWNVSNVIYTFNMFDGNTKFNLPIDDWNTSAVQNAGGMFKGATKFNQPIYKWDMSNNREFGEMFSGATAFDMDLSHWDTSRSGSFWYAFSNSGLWPAHYSAFLEEQANGSPARGNYIPLHSSAKYLCGAEDARTKLTNSPADATVPGKGWTIYDAGKAACLETQTITFDDIDTVANTNSFAENKVQPLIATATSGLTTTFKWISGPCQVSGNKLTATAGSAGKVCVIAAQQHGDATYSDAVQVLHWINIDPAAATFSVVYDTNLADSGSVTDATSYLDAGEVTVLGKNNLVRAGYKFTGWNTKANGTGTAYKAGDKITIANADVLLFAQWTAIVAYNYSITFDKGTADSGSLASQSGSDEAVTLSSFDSGDMVKAGYHFTGWLSDDSTTTYSDGETITLSGEFTHTLTAQWALNPSTSKPDAPKKSEVNVFYAAGLLNIYLDYSGTDEKAPTRYNVTIQPGGKTCQIDGAKSNCQISGIRSNVEFKLMITASNAIGTSSLYYSKAKYVIRGGVLFSSEGSNSFTNFGPDSSKLTKALKNSIKKYVQANPQMTHFTCTGYIAGFARYNTSAPLAKARAVAVCGYIKSLRPSATVTAEGKTPKLSLLPKNRKVEVFGYTPIID